MTAVTTEAEAIDEIHELRRATAALLDRLDQLLLSLCPAEPGELQTVG